MLTTHMAANDCHLISCVNIMLQYGHIYDSKLKIPGLHVRFCTIMYQAASLLEHCFCDDLAMEIIILEGVDLYQC